jgi:hypothetical protein
MTGNQAAAAMRLTAAWWVWRDVAVRSSGFAIDDLLALGKPELAAAVDAAPATEPIRAGYQAALDDSLATLAAIVDSDQFREALLWQNKRMLANAVEPYLASHRAGAPRLKKRRYLEACLTNYVQRYYAKNESVGFFGPVGWAHWAGDSAVGSGNVQTLSVTGFQADLAVRNAQFEVWAIRALAEQFSTDPQVRRWLIPRVPPTVRQCEGGWHTAVRGWFTLPCPQRDVLAACDGERTVMQIAQQLMAARIPGIGSIDDVEHIVGRLERMGYVALGISVPPTPDPDRFLRRRVEEIPDPAVRLRCTAALGRLQAAAQAVRVTAADHRRLAAALDLVDAEFTDLTGRAARVSGPSFPRGKALLVEDCQSALDAVLGPTLRENLAPPLDLMLTSARWMVSRIAAHYTEILQGIYKELQPPDGHGVGLAAICYEFWPRCAPEVVRAESASLVNELQRRWTEILAVPPGVRRHRVAAADIADAVRQQFAATGVPWLSGRFNSPDVMIAADGVAAVERGDYEWVLGELHTGLNSLNQSTFIRLHPHPERVRAMADEDACRGSWLIPVWPSSWPEVTNRSYPPPFLGSDRFEYLQFAAEPPRDLVTGPVLPISALTMVRDNEGDLRIDAADGRRFHPMAVLGEFLSICGLAELFRPLPPEPHRPRINIDTLVIGREQWNVTLATLSWLRLRDETERYRAIRQWAGGLGLPRFIFVRVTHDTKPYYVDLTSPLLANMISRTLRTAADADEQATVAITEMYPDPARLWLPHSPPGRRCTSELRMAIVDRAVS